MLAAVKGNDGEVLKVGEAPLFSVVTIKQAYFIFIYILNASDLWLF